MAKLSPQAKRLIEQMKRTEGFLTPSQARSNRDVVSELLDNVKIGWTIKDGVEGYKLLGFTPEAQEPREAKTDAHRRFVLSDAGQDAD